MPADLRKNEWLGINPGLLRHRIHIQVSVETQDEFNQPIAVWENLVENVNANVAKLTGQELFEARQLHAESTYRIITRYVKNLHLTPKHRIVFGEKQFDILSIINLEERNLIFEIMAKERL